MFNAPHAIKRGVTNTTDWPDPRAPGYCEPKHLKTNGAKSGVTRRDTHRENTFVKVNNRDMKSREESWRMKECEECVMKAYVRESHENK